MTIYDLTTTTLEGKPLSLETFSGKVTLFVNVASFCGSTPQYTGLEALHQRLAARGFSVIGVPSNEFGAQEPGSAQEILAFCSKKYGVTFPLLAKTEVKPGAGQSPIYAELSAATGKVPSWNFAKYVVGRNGKVLAYFENKVQPDDERLLAVIERALSLD